MEVPTQIELNVGETYTLKLPGLGAAGYQWIHEVTGNSDLIAVSVTTARRSPSSDEGRFPVVGSSVDEVFTLKAQKIGRTYIRFIQRRLWEQNQPPLKEYLLEIHIRN